jgi:hypothetical protein
MFDNSELRLVIIAGSHVDKQNEETAMYVD